MKTIQMTIDEPLLAEVDQAIKALNTTRSAFIRQALQLALQRYKILEMEKKQIVERLLKNQHMADALLTLIATKAAATQAAKEKKDKEEEEERQRRRKQQQERKQQEREREREREQQEEQQRQKQLQLQRNEEPLYIPCDGLRNQAST